MVRGDGPAPSFVIEVIKGLPDTSLTSALARGGRQFQGWGVDRYLMAELYDALNANTMATGNWKSKPPKPKPFPRPQVEDLATTKKKVSVRELHSRFGSKLHGKG